MASEISSTHAHQLQREEWCSLLAQCNDLELLANIEKILNLPEFSLNINVVMPARTGTTQLPVREPVTNEQFYIGDGLVTTAEVSVNGLLGWAMRLGSHKEATVAAAIADAILCDDSSVHRETLFQYLLGTHQLLARSEDEDWAMLQTTIVEFEELD